MATPVTSTELILALREDLVTARHHPYDTLANGFAILAYISMAWSSDTPDFTGIKARLLNLSTADKDALYYFLSAITGYSHFLNIEKLRRKKRRSEGTIQTLMWALTLDPRRLNWLDQDGESCMQGLMQIERNFFKNAEMGEEMKENARRFSADFRTWGLQTRERMEWEDEKRKMVDRRKESASLLTIAL